MKFDYVVNKFDYKGYVIYEYILKMYDKLSDIKGYDAFEISDNKKNLIASSDNLKSIKNKINNYIKKHSKS